MSLPILFWVGLIAGGASVVLYFAALAARPRLVRIVNGSGLFLTGLGLVQAAFLVRAATPPLWFNANIAILALTLAAAMQSYAVLRNRRAWDGVDRRQSDDVDGASPP